ncbi:fibroblast growth factor-binding protein 1-like [Cynocephalus volans]|uniref:fibroblast growth factor-binding protein 1-like n=1 Tax=Cynocephalus volans TaxID=110931 RepID=UPI002FC8C8BA
MRSHSLTLLSFLLLATQVLLMHIQKGVKIGQQSKPDLDRWFTMESPENGAEVQPSDFVRISSFTIENQTVCEGRLTEKGYGIVALKIDCTRNNSQFSCVFTGNIDSCLESLEHKLDYLGEIIRSLKLQKNVCGNSTAMLMTSVCGSKFEESNLKLVSSTLLNSQNPSQDGIYPTHQEQIKIKLNSTTEFIPVKEINSTESIKNETTNHKEQILVTETAPTSPAHTQTRTTTKPHGRD